MSEQQEERRIVKIEVSVTDNHGKVETEEGVGMIGLVLEDAESGDSKGLLLGSWSHKLLVGGMVAMFEHMSKHGLRSVLSEAMMVHCLSEMEDLDLEGGEDDDTETSNDGGGSFSDSDLH